MEANGIPKSVLMVRVTKWVVPDNLIYLKKPKNGQNWKLMLTFLKEQKQRLEDQGKRAVILEYDGRQPSLKGRVALFGESPPLIELKTYL